MKLDESMAAGTKSTAAAEREGKILLSVIIPAYNLQDDIGTCLDSVLNQGIEDMEVLVVDNGSTDGTAEVLKRYEKKFPQVKPIYLKENCWPSGARNAALDAARGKYIHFCDGDDMVPEGAYQEVLKIAEDQEADIVVGNYSRKYPAERNCIRPFSHYQAETGFERCFESGNTTLWNKVYRRSLIEDQHLRFSMELRHSEDFLLYLQMLLQDPTVAYTDSSIYIYTDTYCHEESDNTNTQIRYASLQCVLDSIYVYDKIFARKISDHQELWFECYCGNINWTLQCSWRIIQDPQERREAFEQLQKALRRIQETTDACDWTKGNHMQRFVDIFGTDFYTFASMSYEDFLFLFYQRHGIRPRGANRTVYMNMDKLKGAARDQALAQGARQIMDDIRAAYDHEITGGRYLWKSHYYNLLDSALNDYWRLIVSRPLKQELYDELQRFVREMREENSLCAINSEADIRRFQEIFCLDYAAFQAMSLSRYMLLCATSSCGGGSAYYAPRSLEAYVSACRNGQIGMRGILMGIKAWLKFKLHR